MMIFLKQCVLITSMLWGFAECRIGSGDVVHSNSVSMVPGEVREIRSLQGELERQVIYLLPFDIKIALEGNSSPEDVNIYALKEIVTDWMDASFTAKSENEGLLSNGAAFDYVLLEIANRRELQDDEDPAPTFYKAVFRGFSVWNLATSDTDPVNSELVELIQRATFLEDKSLLELIRTTDTAEFGLGSAVLDVRAEVSGSTTNGGDAADDDDDTDDTLQLIIMIAIVVACLAFCLLMFAVIWAWRTDRAKREAYKVGRNQPGVVATDPTESKAPRSPERPKSPARKSPSRALPPQSKPVQNLPPKEIPTQSDYPESVISDSVVTDSVISNDVDTSFTGYSMPHQQPSATTPSSTFQPREVSDAASISSMDSYGYSLDGYASSLGGPAQSKFPGGALSMPANTTGGSLGADESDVDLAPSENGDSVKH
jgi:hypothetical protein